MHPMRPGEHVVIVGTERDALQARFRGLHLRDTFTILLPGPRSLTAFLFRAPLDGTVAENVLKHGCGGLDIKGYQTEVGRWPTNLLLVHGPGCRAGECQQDCPVGLLDAMSGMLTSGFKQPGQRSRQNLDQGWHYREGEACYADSGGASRYYSRFQRFSDAVNWLEGLVASPQG